MGCVAMVNAGQCLWCCDDVGKNDGRGKSKTDATKSTKSTKHFLNVSHQSVGAGLCVSLFCQMAKCRVTIGQFGEALGKSDNWML